MESAAVSGTQKSNEATSILLSLLAQLSILGLLTLQLTRRLQKAGESTSKALFAESPSLPTGGVREEAPTDHF